MAQGEGLALDEVLDYLFVVIKNKAEKINIDVGMSTCVCEGFWKFSSDYFCLLREVRSKDK